MSCIRTVGLFCLGAAIAACLAAHASAQTKTARTTASSSPAAGPQGGSRWVYNLPPSEQTRRVSIRVQVVDPMGRPVRLAKITAHCEPWHYQTRGARADGDGTALITGPIGDWTFCAGAPRYLAMARLRARADGAVILRPDGEIRVSLHGLAGTPAKAMRMVDRRIVGGPASLQFLPVGSDEPLHIGNLADGVSARLAATIGMQGHLWITRDMGTTSEGFALVSPVDTARSREIAFLPNRLARLELNFDGFGVERRAVLSLRPGATGANVGRSAFRTPPAGGRGVMLLSAGAYRYDVGLPGGDPVEFLGDRFTIQPGARKLLRFGNRFKVEPKALVWDHQTMHLWFDILDNYGTIVHQFGSRDECLRLAQGGDVLHLGPSPEGRTRHFPLKRDWRPVWSNGGDLHYDYRASNTQIGGVEGSGAIAASPAQALNHADIPVKASSEHFEVRFINCSTEAADQVAQGLEKAYDWLATEFAGPVTRGGGGKWEIRSLSPVGVGWGGGNGIGMGLYAANSNLPASIDGHTFVLFHELGHVYQSSPPHHQAKGTGANTCEAFASLISAYCMRVIHGEPGYLFNARNFARSFFDRRSPPGGNVKTTPDDYDFIFCYIHDRFGDQVHRQFARIMYRSEGNAEDLILGTSFLRTEGERVASLYSLLTGENLAWLFRWAGEDVSDSTVDRAVNEMQRVGVVLPK